MSGSHFWESYICAKNRKKRMNHFCEVLVSAASTKAVGKNRLCWRHKRRLAYLKKEVWEEEWCKDREVDRRARLCMSLQAWLRTLTAIGDHLSVLSRRPVLVWFLFWVAFSHCCVEKPTWSKDESEISVRRLLQKSYRENMNVD